MGVASVLSGEGSAAQHVSTQQMVMGMILVVVSREQRVELVSCRSGPRRAAALHGGMPLARRRAGARQTP